jgi:hypothetical protein
MMRRLKSGEFDERAFSIQAPLLENYEIEAPKPDIDQVTNIFSTPARQSSNSKSDLSLLFELPVKSTSSSQSISPQSAEKPAKNVVNLDDAILNFFGANEK